MVLKKSSLRNLLSAVAVTSCLLIGVSASSRAQNNSGLTLWSGVARENQLSYYLDYGGQPNGWDRYRLRIPPKKLELGVAQFSIAYPDYFDGKFDKNKIEVRVKGKSLPLSGVNLDEENHLIQIDLREPIPAQTRVELVFSNVKNPPFGGTYYFNCQTMSPGDVPIPRYCGTWILTIGS